MRLIELRSDPPGGSNVQVRLTPADVAAPENNGGWASPPASAAGGAQLVISNPDAYTFFSFDSEYFIDFTPVAPPP